jgi:hypothetical protein
MIEETSLPWTPLPERFGRNWQVDAVHLAEVYGENMRERENLSTAVSAYSEPTATSPREDGARRIDFRHCQAYRMRIINYAGADPLTRIDRERMACWEIAPSRYVVESGVHGAYQGQQIHH